MMSSKDRRMLEKNRPKLMGVIDIEASTLLAELRARDVITVQQEQIIVCQKGSYQQVGKLLDFLSRGDVHTVDRLVYALRASEQIAVTNTYLREPTIPDTSDDEEDSSLSASKPASHSLGPEFEKHMPVLLAAMPYKIHDCLIKNNLLSRNDLDTINVEKTIRDQNLKMYKILSSRAVDPAHVAAAVCEGLCQTSQYCPFAPPDRRQEPVSKPQHEEIRMLRERLLEDMEVSPVLDRLLGAEIVDRHIAEWINAGRTRRERVDSLLSFMSRTHSQAHTTFMQILRESNDWIFDVEEEVEEVE